MAASKFKNVFKQSPNSISTIFFDMDNTLIHTRKGDSKACSKVITIFVFFLLLLLVYVAYNN